jgi:predicted  nucleic acid-binding Zn-ribbon protein
MSETKNTSEKEQKVKTLRADDDTFEKFKKLASDEFGNQGQCLSALINIYETENAKAVLVDRKLEIESFQDYLNKISNLFVTSLQLNADAEGRIREEFARQLNIKDQSIESLQDQTTKLKEELQKIKAGSEEIAARSKEIEKLNLGLEKDKKTLEGLVSKNDELLEKNKDEIASLASMLNEYKSYKTENVTLSSKIEEFKQLLQDEKNSNKSKELEINSLNKEVTGLNNSIVELKAEIKEEKALAEKVRVEYKQELATVEDKFNERLAKEIESIKAAFADKLTVEKKSLENEKTELDLSYKKQINEYVSQINEFKSTIKDQETMIASLMTESQNKGNEIIDKESLIEALVKENNNPDLLKKLGLEK